MESNKEKHNTINSKELNLYRAAGLTFTVSGVGEIVVIPSKDRFDVDNPGKSIDTSKMIEELQYLIGFVEKISNKLSNKDFISRAPEKVIEIEYKKINDSMIKIRTIRETLNFIYNISDTLEKKEQLKKVVLSNNKYNDAQKHYLINEIDEADEYFIKHLENLINKNESN
jgi:hypothetical protein